MTARLTTAQARRLGLLDHAQPLEPARVRTTRRAVPRDGAATICHTCGERFTGDAGEARHCADTGHHRYELELT